MNEGYTIPVLDSGYVRYIGHYGSDMTIVNAARISYQGTTKGEEADKKLLHYLWKNKHTSPFEMVKIHLNIKMPIFVMRQYVRHRMQNLNEVSARYSQLPNDFYIPLRWRKQDTKNKQGSVETDDLFVRGAGEDRNEYTHQQLSKELERHSKRSYELYENLLDCGVAREMARMVLPVNIYTEIQCVWDMKNLIHFITLRDDSHAQAEIQEYGKAIKGICKEIFPWVIEAYDKYKWQCIEIQ